MQSARILCLLAFPLGVFTLITALSLGDPRAIGLFLGCCGATAFVLLLFIGLKSRWRNAWYAQILISALGLLAIPVGTVIHGLILSKWFKPEVKAWFGLSTN